MRAFLQMLKRLLNVDSSALSEPPALLAVRQRAAAGDGEAQCRLADMYYDGEQVTQNYSAAAEWYRRAAEGGHVAAQFQIGNMLRVGLGVHQDMPQALQWLQRAADQGDPAAHTLLTKLAQAPIARERAS